MSAREVECYDMSYTLYNLQENVEQENCDRCKAGFYDLHTDNLEGCRQCFCFGISTVCQSAGLGLVQVSLESPLQLTLSRLQTVFDTSAADDF